jgi:hypothetical protein
MPTFGYVAREGEPPERSDAPAEAPAVPAEVVRARERITTTRTAGLTAP